MKKVDLLFLDIDGTVRRGFDELGKFVNDVEDVKVFDDAVGMMYRWKRMHAGGRNVGVSNQGGIGCGILTKAQVEANMAETQKQCEGQFDLMLFCEHNPNENCYCRKPQPGMIKIAIRKLKEKYPDEVYPLSSALMVGDRDEDEACADAANVPFCPAKTWRDLY